METNDGIARSGRPTHVIPAHLLGQAVKRIEAANRRLASAGAAERFTYDVTREMRTDTRFHGGAAISTAFEVAVITLSAPVIAVGGWRFLAAVDQAEAGLITRTAPEVDLSGWRPQDMRCEHCGHKRARRHTYLIEHADGRRMQIGSTCLAPFLGVSPAGLWVLGADLLDEDEYDVDLWLTGGGIGGTMSIPTQHVIALALTISDDARSFVSRAAAGEGRATVDRVREALNPTRDTSAAWLAQMSAGTHARIDDGRADAALAVIRAVDGESDWATNVRTIAAGEWTDYTHLALLVSGLVVIRRQIENAAREQAPAPAAGYAAPVGTKVKGTHVMITAVREFESFNPYTGYEETRSQVVMADDAGHQLIWWTTTNPDIAAGDGATLTGGTVKAHDVYRDVDQTVLTRCKLAVDVPETAPANPHME